MSTPKSVFKSETVSPEEAQPFPKTLVENLRVETEKLRKPELQLTPRKEKVNKEKSCQLFGNKTQTGI